MKIYDKCIYEADKNCSNHRGKLLHCKICIHKPKTNEMIINKKPSEPQQSIELSVLEKFISENYFGGNEQTFKTSAEIALELSEMFENVSTTKITNALLSLKTKTKIVDNQFFWVLYPKM